MRYFLLFLFFPFFLNAQDYRPMAVEGAKWFIFQNAPVDSNKLVFGYVIKGDSIVNGIHFKKVYYREYEFNGFPITPPYQMENEEYYALIRDDTSARKVYAIGAHYDGLCWQDTTIGETWYDFSKEVGDTLVDQCVYKISGSDTILLDSISIDTYYGYARRTFHGFRWFEFEDSLWKGQIEPYFIEGIGSKRGLFDPAIGLEYISEAVVFLVDYCIGSDADCQITTSVQEPNFIEHSISPNPVQNQLNFQFGSDAQYPVQITIYNQLGQKVDAWEVHASALNYNCSEFLSGIYYYTLQHDGQVVGKGRFVKQ